MLSTLAVLSLSFVGDNFYHHYNVGNYSQNDSYSVDYVLQYSGETNTQFSTAFNPSFIIDTFYDNQTSCELECNNLDNCLGYVNYNVDSGVYHCNILSNLGTESYTTRDSQSYKKMLYYNHPKNLGYSGISFTTGNVNKNMTVYLDLNHNGVLDPGEPRNYTDDGYYFELNGIDQGMYTLRTTVDDDLCVQLYPSVLGYSYGFMGNGIADFVKYYHSHNNSLQGGVINYSLPYNTPISFNYILNKENNTYLSFTHGDTIVLGFSNEAILDHDGAELFFNTYRNNDSDVYGVVSVSFDDYNFTTLGYLTSNETNFDLETINFTNPVRLVKIDFYSESNSTDTSFNIINLGAVNDLYYYPSFAYYGSYLDRFFIFITDCGFYYSCGIYCDYHITGFDQMSSCEYGCEMFSQTEMCNCSNYDHSIFHIDTTLNETECNLGCDYALGKHIFPNYTLVERAEGLSDDILGNYFNLDSTLGICNSNPECHGITLDLLHHLSTQDSFNYIFSNISRFLVRNELIGNHSLGYMTTTVTSTPTSSATSTQTSSATSTQTSSATSTQTSSATSTQTSSLTSTPTSSPTITTTDSRNVNYLPSNDSNRDVVIGLSVMATLMVLIAAGYMYNKKKLRKARIPNYSTTPSFSNPAYEVSDNLNGPNQGGYLDIDYEDKPEMLDGGYMDVTHASDV